MDISQYIKSELFKLKEDKYKSFSSALIPNISNILGVRLPYLRKLAKKIIKLDWQTFLEVDCEYFEETLLQAMVIGLIGEFKRIEPFIKKINNWSVCDSFCCSLKFISKYQKETWKLITKYATSSNEYEIRFALVMILNYYIEIEYLPKIFNILDKFQSDKYYAQMSAAWLLSMCYVKYPQETETYIKTSKLDNFTFNKSIQKIIESNQINKQTKEHVKNFKR